MAESIQHIELVKNMADFVNTNYFNLKIFTDIQERPGDVTPPIIKGSKPDLYAFSSEHHNLTKHNNLNSEKSCFIIGEAKTSSDLKTIRSEKQIKNFLLYLEKFNRPSFILAVPFLSSNEAKSRLNFFYQDLKLSNTDCIVYDEVSSWRLMDTSWHLI